MIYVYFSICKEIVSTCFLKNWLWIGSKIYPQPASAITITPPTPDSSFALLIFPLMRCFLWWPWSQILFSFFYSATACQCLWVRIEKVSPSLTPPALDLNKSLSLSLSLSGEKEKNQSLGVRKKNRGWQILPGSDLFSPVFGNCYNFQMPSLLHLSFFFWAYK